MKKLSLEKIEQTSGGWSLEMGCNFYAAAMIIQSGFAAGSDEAIILGSLAYGACMMV